MVLLGQAGAPSGAISGRILHADGTPAVALGVGAVPRPDFAATVLPASLLTKATRTDGDGKYRLENLPPGRYYVAAGTVQFTGGGGVSPNNPNFTVLNQPVFFSGNAKPVAIDAVAGTSVDGSFRLPPEPPSAAPVYRISGHILFGGRANPDTFGPGGEVLWLFRGKDCGPRLAPQPVAFGFAGLDAYEIRNVPPGAYAICVPRGSDVIVGTGYFGPFNLTVVDRDVSLDFDLRLAGNRGQPGQRRGASPPPAVPDGGGVRGAR